VGLVRAKAGLHARAALREKAAGEVVLKDRGARAVLKAATGKAGADMVEGPVKPAAMTGAAGIADASKVPLKSTSKS
jgi:hypothetical protein